MKTNKKFIVLVLALIMMCLCLTGCSELDELREQHAIFTTKDDFSSITLNGTEYKRIDVEHPPYPTNSVENKRNPITVTQPDVPLLLSEYFEFGNTLFLSDDNNFIYGQLYMYEEFEDDEVLYCKADMYDDISSKVEQGLEYNKYALSYTVYETDTDVQKRYVLTQEEIDAVNKVVKEIEPINNDGKLRNFDYIYHIERITDDTYFGTKAYEVMSDGKNYALFENDYYTDIITKHIPVPEDMKDVFVKLEKIAYNNEGAFHQFVEAKG